MGKKLKRRVATSLTYPKVAKNIFTLNFKKLQKSKQGKVKTGIIEI
jgi:hypothetical protein